MQNYSNTPSDSHWPVCQLLNRVKEKNPSLLAAIMFCYVKIIKNLATCVNKLKLTCFVPSTLGLNKTV